MDLTIEKLVAKGYTEVQAKDIIETFSATLKDNYIPKHRFDEVNNELKTAKESLTERDTQISGLKKFEGTATELQSKVATLENENKTKAEQYAKELSMERKRNAVKFELLADAEGKPYDADLVVGMFDLEKVSIDPATNKISSGFKEQRDTIRKEKTFLFDAQKQAEQNEQTQNTGWKPKGNTPPDGAGKDGIGDTATIFGKGLASVKLGMLGKTPATTNTAGTNNQ